MKKSIYWELAVFMLILVVTSSFISSFNVENYVKKEYMGSYSYFYLNQITNKTGKIESLKNIYAGVQEDGTIKITEMEDNGWSAKVRNILINPPRNYSKNDVPVETACITGDIIYVGNYFGKIYYSSMSSGHVIGENSLSSMNLTFNEEEYRIIRGDENGNMWLYFQGENKKYIVNTNSSKYTKIWSYPFKGYLEQSEWWNNGIILEFAHERNHTIYYFNNGTVKWKINVMHSSVAGIPQGVSVHGGNVYSYAGSNLSVYRNGLPFKKYKFSGDIYSLGFIENRTFVFTSSTSKTFLYVLDKELKLQHKVLLFDFNWIEVNNYTLSNQRAAIYLENKESYIVYLYTYSDGLVKNKTPVRIIHLDKGFEVTGRELMSIFKADKVFPSFQKNSIIEMDEFGDFYITQDADKVIFESWLFVPVAFASIPAALYLYLKYPGERKSDPLGKSKKINE